MVLTAGYQAGSSTWTFSFDGIRISNSRFGNGPSTGSVILTVIGSYTRYMVSSSHFRVGNSGSEATIWKSDTSIQAGLPSCMSRAQCAITVGEQAASVSKMFSHDHPHLASLSVKNSPVFGGVVVTTEGSSLGMHDYSPVVAFGVFDFYYPCVESLWLSDTSVQCRSTKGFGSLNMYFTVGHLQGTQTQSFSYDTCNAGTYAEIYDVTSGSTVSASGRDRLSDIMQAMMTVDTSIRCIDCASNSWSPPASISVGNCSCNDGYIGPDGGLCTACGRGKYFFCAFSSLPCTWLSADLLPCTFDIFLIAQMCIQRA